jgi:hypothetical protein
MKTRAFFSLMMLAPALALAQAGQVKGRPQNENAEPKAVPPAVRGVNDSGVRRIDKETVDALLTVRELLGKSIVNAAGTRIGEVKDIVPGGPGPLSPLAENRTTAAEARPGALAPGQPKERANQADDLAPGDSWVIISSGGIAGIGAVLFRAPLSHLKMDASGRRLTLDLSEAELSQLKQIDQRYPDTAN